MREALRCFNVTYHKMISLSHYVTLLMALAE